MRAASSGLEFLKPIGAPAGPAERGIAVHRAIERFDDGADPALLASCSTRNCAARGISPERRAAERARLAVSINALIDWFAARRRLGLEVYREKKGELALTGASCLSGIADRIEIGASYVAIFDFKTGAPASKPQVESGLAPQLPLEAAMLARGAFRGRACRARHRARLLALRQCRADAEAAGARRRCRRAKKRCRRCEVLLQRYARAEQPFLSKPRVQFIKPYLEYDQLARRKEWADAEGEE